jgi:hypothetical protein
VLTELYNLSTLDLEVTDIRFDQQQARFLIRGTAETMSSVFLFIEKLEKSRYLKDVKTNHDQAQDGNRDVRILRSGRAYHRVDDGHAEASGTL